MRQKERRRRTGEKRVLGSKVGGGLITMCSNEKRSNSTHTYVHIRIHVCTYMYIGTYVHVSSHSVHVPVAPA